MGLKLDIDEDKLVGFSEQAQKELISLLELYSETLISEAARIEAGQRHNSQPPDISRAILIEANDVLNRPNRKVKTKWWMYLARVISPISGVVTGTIFKPDDFNKLNPLLVFILVMSIFLISTMIAVFFGGNNEK